MISGLLTINQSSPLLSVSITSTVSLYQRAHLTTPEKKTDFIKISLKLNFSYQDSNQPDS